MNKDRPDMKIGYEHVNPPPHSSKTIQLATDFFTFHKKLSYLHV